MGVRMRMRRERKNRWFRIGGNGKTFDEYLSQHSAIRGAVLGLTKERCSSNDRIVNLQAMSILSSTINFCAKASGKCRNAQRLLHIRTSLPSRHADTINFLSTVTRNPPGRLQVAQKPSTHNSNRPTTLYQTNKSNSDCS